MEETEPNTRREVRGGKSFKQGGGVQGERGLGRAGGAGGRGMGERTGVSRKQLRPYGLKELV